jgi:hydrogenase maturation protein HypF
VIAARFHKGLARAVAAMVAKVSEGDGADGANGARVTDTVALTGGCFQNKLLFEEVARRLEAAGFRVLGHAAVPANDGGLALGQAAVAAAQLMPA